MQTCLWSQALYSDLLEEAGLLISELPWDASSKTPRFRKRALDGGSQEPGSRPGVYQLALSFLLSKTGPLLISQGCWKDSNGLCDCKASNEFRAFSMESRLTRLTVKRESPAPVLSLLACSSAHPSKGAPPRLGSHTLPAHSRRATARRVFTECTPRARPRAQRSSARSRQGRDGLAEGDFQGGTACAELGGRRSRLHLRS